MSGLITVPKPDQETSVRVAAPRQLSATDIADLIGPWLPRIQLFSSNSTLAKEGAITVGHWGIPVSPSTIVDLGKEVDIIAVAARDRAMHYDGETMFSSTNRDSDMYKKIKHVSETDKDSGAMYGTEFLVWVGSQQMFCTLFLGSASARREALSFMSLLNKAAQVYSKLVGTKRKWEIPLIRKTEAFPFDLPTEDAVKKAWDQFSKPDDNDSAEAVNDASGSSSRER